MNGDGGRRPGRSPLRLRRAPVAWDRQRPTWPDADPALITDALKRAQARPSGNWYVLGPASAVTDRRPFGRSVRGVEVVAWRDGSGRLLTGPGACPHLGAPLRDSRVRCGRLVCHWHGLALNGRPTAGWEPFPSYDDGLLAWVRLDRLGGEAPLPRPVIAARPRAADAVATVYTGSARCEPADVIANRLDPWHGAWFHPYAFVDLAVVGTPDGGDGDGSDGRGAGDNGDSEGDSDHDGFTVDVSFKVAGRAVVPVRAVFSAPEPRTVVMRIIRGEGRGSVVESHATPLGPDDRGRPRTAVVEAVVAVSHRPGFAAVRAAAPVVRPLMRAVAERLWRDDLAYAERRWELRGGGRLPG
ncbi:DUF5914 domain-containing protein [Streptomyces sp. NPDC002018]|uniref:DUF5914 domain-containing protein n=1 Tax=Streptomyces sp. NPDC002018 TaxID=3364629 RepID=UPI00367BF092